MLVRFIPIPIISLCVHLWSCFQCSFLAEKTLPESRVFLSLQKVGQLIYYLKHTAKASSKCLLRAVGHRNTYLPQVQNFRIVREKSSTHVTWHAEEMWQNWHPRKQTAGTRSTIGNHPFQVLAVGFEEIQTGSNKKLVVPAFCWGRCGCVSSGTMFEHPAISTTTQLVWDNLEDHPS